MRVLVTGGAGYLGAEVVRRLAAQDEVEDIVVYDDLSRPSFGFFVGPIVRGATVRFVRKTLLDTRALRNLVDRVDVVVHLAARVATPFSNQDPHDFEQVNNWGTAELSYAVEASHVQRLVYVSSASVYGSNLAPRSSVHSEPAPTTHYAISKLRGEGYVTRLSDRLSTLVLRCGNVFGFGSAMRFEAVINRFVWQAHFEGQLAIHGNGRQVRPFVHIDQASRAIAEAATNHDTVGVADLVDRNLSVGQIADVVKRLYPQLEMTYVNQHLDLRSLEVEPNQELLQGGAVNGEAALEDELVAIRDRFSLPPTMAEH